MVLVHLLGGVLVVVGLFLFTYDQIKGRAITSDLAGAKAWSVNLSGPPALILVVFGALLFLFPFSPWWPDRIATPPTTTTIPTTTTSSTTTTVPPTTTTVPPTTTTRFTLDPLDPDDDLPIFEFFPPTPYGASIFYDSECDEDVIEWFQDGSTTIGWQLDIEVYDQFDNYLYEFTLDTASDGLEFGNRSVVCFWDFIDEEIGFTYNFSIWAYNNSQFSQEPLFVEYYDGG